VVTVRVTLQEVINAPTAVINDTTNKVKNNRFIESHFVKKLPNIYDCPRTGANAPDQGSNLLGLATLPFSRAGAPGHTGHRRSSSTRLSWFSCRRRDLSVR